VLCKLPRPPSAGSHDWLPKPTPDIRAFTSVDLQDPQCSLFQNRMARSVRLGRAQRTQHPNREMYRRGLSICAARRKIPVQGPFRVHAYLINNGNALDAEDGAIRRTRLLGIGLANDV